MRTRSASAPSAPASRPRGLVRLAGAVINLLLLASAVVFAALAVGPHLFDYRTATMLTGSMSPVINAGDIVVTVPRPASAVEVGDVITYQIPVEDRRVETHRVIEVRERPNGSVAVVTKGDANPTRDPWVAEIADDTVWEVVAVVPAVGHAIGVLRTPVLRQVLLWSAVIGAVGLGLAAIWRPATRAGDEPARGTVLDVAALAELSPPGDDTVVDLGRRFAGRFHELLPGRVRRIEAALGVGDVEEGLEAALSLKVSSMTAGAYELAVTALRVEKCLRAEDLEGARETLPQLRPAAARLGHALTAYLAA
ncbi:signal peptidase I [Nocardioides sp. GCM10027113]|uniref:signal peptidase I n=1 Tax=unclassified Nocardioides TaxID=2615069 RepID=UPI0036076A45